MEDESANDPEEEEQGSSTADGASHPKRHRQLPICFQDSDSEGDDRVLCTICDQKEPPGCSAEIVFWVIAIYVKPGLTLTLLSRVIWLCTGINVNLVPPPIS